MARYIAFEIDYVKVDRAMAWSETKTSEIERGTFHGNGRVKIWV